MGTRILKVRIHIAFTFAINMQLFFFTYPIYKIFSQKNFSFKKVNESSKHTGMVLIEEK